MLLSGLSNVGRVTPVIFRGAQPEPQGYETLAKMGIKTVINLRTTKNEKKEVEAAGMKYVGIPINVFKNVDRDKVEQVIQQMSDPAYQPVYVHCKLGEDRTGIVIAAYRMKVEGWSLEEAEAEMQAFGFNDIWQNLKYFLREYAEDILRERQGFWDKIKKDVQVLSISREGLGRAVEFANARPYLFSARKSNDSSLMKRHEKMTAWTTWSIILDYVSSLDRLAEIHSDYYQIKNKSMRKASFQVAYGAFLAEYRFALEFLAIVENNKNLNTILNEKVSELGLPENTFSRFKYRFLNVARASEFVALQVIDKGVSGDKNSTIKQAIEEDKKAIWQMGKGDGIKMTMHNAVQIAQNASFAAWFPVQKGVSKLMGDIRVRRWGTSLIKEDLVHSIISRLEPGDIILQRREWYLSNLGLPGFWTHAALYIGSADERRQFFNNIEVQKWVKSSGTTDGDFEKLLRSLYPEAYAKSLTVQGDGYMPRVLEAIAEGVSFTTLEHSAAADSIAVLRPRLSKKGRAYGILRAFHYSGRPYDFNFDFLTDSSLVCSELIYKVYEVSNESKGLIFPINEIMGRKMITPNAMAQQFDETFGTDRQQFDLVLFLDGYEKADMAIEATQKVFRLSWQRPKWHIVLQKM